MKELLRYVSPFKDEELPNIKLANLQSDVLIHKHKKCIEILEGIHEFEKRKKNRIESIEGFGGTFPNLRSKYVNDIDTIHRAIKRLEERYIRLLDDLHID